MSKIHQIKCGNVNSYIVSNGSNAILVDTGREKYKEKVLKECRNFNIRLIVLTHGHVDHIQNTDFLAEQLKVPVAMSKSDISLIGDNMTQQMSSSEFLGKIILSASIKSFRKDKVSTFMPTVFLNGGDSLNEYGIQAKIIDLPGHTKGSIGIDVDNESLIAGDALMNMFYPTVSHIYTDRDMMIKSAAKISNLGNRKIYFGHGSPVNNKVWVKR